MAKNDEKYAYLNRLNTEQLEELLRMDMEMAEPGNEDVVHDKRMNDCLPPILFSAIFKLLKVLPDTELDAC